MMPRCNRLANFARMSRNNYDNLKILAKHRIFLKAVFLRCTIQPVSGNFENPITNASIFLSFAKTFEKCCRHPLSRIHLPCGKLLTRPGNTLVIKDNGSKTFAIINLVH